MARDTPRGGLKSSPVDRPILHMPAPKAEPEEAADSALPAEARLDADACRGQMVKTAPIMSALDSPVSSTVSCTSHAFFAAAGEKQRQQTQ